jgi:hypothetical protein
MQDEDLRQADLSHLRLGDMTDEQKAEMRRRYADFVSRLGKPPAPPPRRVKMPGPMKWAPAKKVR